MTKPKLNTKDKKGSMLLPALIQERHKLYEDRLAALQRPTALDMPTRITNAGTKGSYDGAELRPFEGRPGAMDAYALPSRGIGG